MPYNSYFPATYTPYGYQPYPQQPVQQPVQQPQAPVQPPVNVNNGLVWVQGESGAKSYLVAPNATVMLMDSEKDRFFLKSADASGMPLPLRVFEYKEIKDGERNMDMKNYVTREEFEAKFAEILQMKEANKDEPTV